MTKKILIVGPAWVGDMVMAQTLFKLLKQHDPNVVLDVLAPQWSLPLLARMPEVSQSIVMPLGHGQLQLGERRRLGKSLASAGYAESIVLANSFKSALVPWWAKIPKRTGWLGEMRWGLLNDVRYNPKRFPLMIERFMALGIPAGTKLPAIYPIPELKITAESRAEALAKFQLEFPTRPVLALCPGAEFGPSKRWPDEYYAEVANAKLAAGWDVWLFGSAKDAPYAEHIQQLTQGKCVDFTGRTSLSEAIDLLSLATVVVSNDSGLMHISAALNRPVVVVYGSTSPDFTPPLQVNAQILKLSLPCQPCFKRTCPLQHHRCMRDLSSHKVIDAIAEFEKS